MGTWLTKRSTRNDWSRRFILAISSDLLAYTRYDKLCICMCVSACVCVRLWVGMSVAAHTVHSVNNSIVSSVIATAWIEKKKWNFYQQIKNTISVCLFVSELVCSLGLDFKKSVWCVWPVCSSSTINHLYGAWMVNLYLFTLLFLCILILFHTSMFMISIQHFTLL